MLTLEGFVSPGGMEMFATRLSKAFLAVLTLLGIGGIDRKRVA